MRIVVAAVLLLALGLTGCGRSSVPHAPDGADQAKSPILRRVSPTEYDPML